MMKLADVNKPLTYQTTFPLSGKTVTYRPFLVREQKALLQVQQAGNPQDVIATLCTLIDECCHNTIDSKKLSPIDFEWLLIQLRIKSVGSVIKLSITCPKCSTKTQYTGSLDALEVRNLDSKNNLVQIAETLYVEMKVPSMEEINKLGDAKEDQLAACLAKLINGDDVYSMVDFTQAEILEFIDTLSKPQMDEIEVWLNKLPEAVLPINLKCSKCDHEINHSVTGLMNFLA